MATDFESARIGSAVAQSQANPIAKKLNKILDSKIETDQELLLALENASGFFGENSLQNRRNLRRDIEGKSLEANLRFLDSFRKVKQRLDDVSADVGEMSGHCRAMTDRLRATKEQTRDLLEQTTKLQKRRRQVEKRAEVINAFLAAFQLLPAEKTALEGTADGSVTAGFFPALQRVKQIHADCKRLLRSTAQHVAAMEIMEDMATRQERAYELLYRWIQHECRLLNVDFVDFNPLLYQAFEAMQERPLLFKYSLDEFTTARRNNMVRAFIDALTRGGGGAKPIELLSHEPLRYVGDMLAWIHQAACSELEHLATLLKMCPQQLVDEHTIAVLGQITEGICRPFKVRVEQALNGETNPVSLYRLSNLFSFYGEKLKSRLSEDALMLRTIEELRELTLNMFFSSLNSAVQRLFEKMECPNPDGPSGLQPVSGFHAVLLLLRDCLDSHDGALIAVQNKSQNFERMFGAILDPLHRCIMLSATELTPVEVAVYALNCLSAIHSVLSLYQYTDARLEMIQAQLEAHQDVIVSEQTAFIMRNIGLMSLYEACQQNARIDAPIAEVSVIREALLKFDGFLSKPDVFHLPQYPLITSAKTREAIDKRVVDTLVDAYGLVYRRITDPAAPYQPPLVAKTPEQIRDLLS